jgi:hypothetical protein
MAEHENRPKQDIGQDEAYICDLKEVVSAERDAAGRNRIFFDAIAANTVASIAAINSQIVQTVKQSTVTAGKNDENVIGINETDHVAAQILNSPWAEALKTIMTAAVAESQK